MASKHKGQETKGALGRGARHTSKQCAEGALGRGAWRTSKQCAEGALGCGAQHTSKQRAEGALGVWSTAHQQTACRGSTGVWSTAHQQTACRGLRTLKVSCVPLDLGSVPMRRTLITPVLGSLCEPKFSVPPPGHHEVLQFPMESRTRLSGAQASMKPVLCC